MFHICLIVIAIMFSTTLASARAVPPVEGLEALRKAFAGTADFTAEMTQEKKLSLMKRSMQMNGIVRFRKPDQFYMEIVSPYPSRMVLRDNTIEQSMGKGGERSRILLPPEQGLKQWFSRLTGPVTRIPDGLGVLADLTASLYTITITPQGTGPVREVVISFQEDGTFKKLIISERNGDRAVMSFKKVRRNTGLTEKDFRIE